MSATERSSQRNEGLTTPIYTDSNLSETMNTGMDRISTDRISAEYSHQTRHENSPVPYTFPVAQIFPTQSYQNRLMASPDSVYYGFSSTANENASGTKNCAGIGILIDEQGYYEGRFNSNNFDFIGKIELRGGRGTYLGALKDGMRNGLGLVEIDDLRHFGYFSKDEIEGLGEQEMADGGKVAGWFVEGVLDGFGVSVLKMGEGGHRIERGYYTEGLKEGWVRETSSGNSQAEVKSLMNQFSS